MLKVLVGLAAVAVIAFVGYFFWGEWQKAEAAAAAVAEQRSLAITECALLVVNLERASRGENVGFRFSQAEARTGIARCEAAGLIDDETVAITRGAFAK